MIGVTAMPADTNCYRDIFGGWLVGQMELVAGALASLERGGRMKETIKRAIWPRRRSSHFSPW